MPQSPLSVSSETLRLSLPFHSADAVLLSACHTARTWKMYHEDYTFCIVESGCGGDLRYRGTVSSLHVPHVCVFEPGEAHVTSRQALANVHYLFVAPEALASFLARAGTRRPLRFHRSGILDRSLFKRFAKFLLSTDSETPLCQREDLFVSALAALVDMAGEPADEEPPIASLSELMAVRTFLQGRADETVMLGDLERMAGISRFHLVRLFTNRFGMPPHQFLVHIRLERARRAFAMGQDPDTTAFADQSHFIRLFKRTYGVTPSAYRSLFCRHNRVQDAFILREPRPAQTRLSTSL